MQIGIYQYMLSKDFDVLQRSDHAEWSTMRQTYNQIFIDLAQCFLSEGCHETLDWIGNIIQGEAQEAFDNDTLIQHWGSDCISNHGSELDPAVATFFQQLAEDAGEDYYTPEYHEAIELWFMPRLESELTKAIHRKVIALKKELWEQCFGDTNIKTSGV